MSYVTIGFDGASVASATVLIAALPIFPPWELSYLAVICWGGFFTSDQSQLRRWFWHQGVCNNYSYKAFQRETREHSRWWLLVLEKLYWPFFAMSACVWLVCWPSFKDTCRIIHLSPHTHTHTFAKIASISALGERWWDLLIFHQCWL